MKGLSCLFVLFYSTDFNDSTIGSFFRLLYIARLTINENTTVIRYAYINEDGGISEADEIQNTVKYKGYVTKKENKPALKTAITEFPRILESEFKGIDGLDDMTSDTLEISDNISTLTVLGSVNYATNQEITLRFTEKAGRTITTYCSAYLRAIRDPRTRAKTYRGCANIFAKDATVSSGEQRIIYPSIEN